MDSKSPGPLSRCTSIAALISTFVRSIPRWKSGCILRLVQGLSPTTHDFFYRRQRRERRYECSRTPSDEADQLTLRYLRYLLEKFLCLSSSFAPVRWLLGMKTILCFGDSTTWGYPRDGNGRVECGVRRHGCLQ